MIKSNFEDLRRKKSYEESRKLPLRVIAEETGLAIATVQRFSSGNIDKVYLSTLDTLCNYFKVGIAELVEHVPDQS